MNWDPDNAVSDPMELESDTNWISEESVFDIMADIGATDLENEKCGICMDVIIDRGLLDCCQHWFCFSCIDNWAAITNLCPLCENEFQLITCVPVYDTIGSGQIEDDVISRDDDWCIQGTNNTLTFPSYYIDENAVICLDGDGCKIRNGVDTVADDSNLDTSIACDSCDIWYHAFCVGFDPEGTYESSWLCPRCVIDEAPRKSNGVSTLTSSIQSGIETTLCGRPVEASLSGILSVSVADAGETAVVVSMIEGKHPIEAPHESLAIEAKKDGQAVTVLFNDEDNIHLETAARETSLSLSLSRDTHFTLCNDPLPCDKLKKIGADKTITKSNDSDLLLSYKPKLGNQSNVELHVGLSLGCSSSVDNRINDAAQNLSAGDLQPNISPRECPVSGGKIALEPTNVVVGSIGVKRKSSCLRNPVTVAEHTKLDDEMPRYQMGKEGSSKKAKLDGTSRGTRSCSGLTIVSKDDNSKDAPEKEAATSDIMSIVRGTNRKSSDGVKKDDGSGLRVKKIMRRTAEDASAKLVENIRKEIREAVRNKSTKDFGKNNLFDPKLLSAFRAATGPRTQQEPIRRLNPSIVKAKNAILQKGKSRENLTKKIYGNAKGRRRRAWNRDCEVEFWKHRCVRASKAEKIETLKSVLNLLRRSSDSSEMEHITDGEAANGILSRVYLADASVFPRKEDIKPFSAFSGLNLKENVSNPIENERPLIHAEITKKDHSNELIFHKKSISSPNGPVKKAQSPKGTMSKSDVNIDKRKWALEVLARKTARLGKDITEDKPEKKAVLKGNFPLLAQLPTDMKPVLGPSCHNKVPISVRQTQLYRLTEYFLKKANLPVIKRTGDTELAVADAVNIEKEVADRSNSKLVYINLCSQVLSQHTHHRDCKKGADSNPSTETTVLNPDQPSSDLSADEALKLAGLVSDEDLSDEDDCLIMPKDEEPDSVFDMDNHPELDIYGDFEYDLGGDDLAIDGSILQVSRSEPEEGDSKLKLVFSTLKSEKPDTGLKSKDHETLEIRRDTLSPPLELLEGEISGEPFLAECEELYGPDKEPLVEKYPIEVSKEPNILNEDRVHEQIDNCRSNEAAKENILSSGGESSSLTKDNGTKKENKTNCKPFDIASSISKKVEAYIKEHIRPLCKSGVITVQQYRWAVDRTTDKVMRYHCKEKNANFLIQEGEKVKKLATQYVEAAQQKECL